MMEIAWLIPLFPLASFCVLLILGKSLREKSWILASFLMLLSTILSLFVLMDRVDQPTFQTEMSWFSIGTMDISFGYQITALNALMLLVVSLISFFIHIYSIGYMKGNNRFPIFYAYLGLFTFAMLSLVMTTNFLQLYMFWELVGVGSFLLIGFYFEREKAKEAAKKAFIMTRIGDVGLFVAIVLLFTQIGSFQYEEIFTSIQNGEVSSSMVTLIAILIFIGAIGKSGQFPLHTWLPDAMEGPTPVSALIHAATMVAAGVYLVAYVYPIFLASETALITVASIGGFTAIFAASIALTQKDIKRILAYSTVSQLGYMMLALGTAGYVASIFHLTTHAFFKALLFLGAGSVIHIVHTQNIDKMGGLKKLKWTTSFFVIGALSLSGVPLFAGFYSKEEIFVSVWSSGHYGLFVIAVLTALFTSFYMFRLVFLVFGGKRKENDDSLKESPKSMRWTMGILAIFAIVIGYLNSPLLGRPLEKWLITDVSWQMTHHDSPAWMVLLSIVVSLGGIALAYAMYREKPLLSKDWASTRAPHLYQLLGHQYFIDRFYKKTFVRGVRITAQIGQWLDRFVVEGIANSVVSLVKWLGKRGALAQNGQTQIYGAVAFGSLAILLVIYALTGGVW
ncbi:NADH-quinone oxidoreductase subunit L [Bacillus sp. FJAT-47783]|uniref:NADH-quinone oxidoreductase subunit L n=1 Tax=Bacillus sp. FJAT-47783 TaxID=2922712 RepID=UPI001FAB5C2C|nr:NADH-quinone oxidoreductase subunit L [Bacillus sp. FJAT-47783]